MKKAFTLVELLVVITILAILGVTAFVSMQAYSKEARDSKRISDTKNILTKINIEYTKGIPLDSLMNHEDRKINKLIIEGNNTTGLQGYPNFENLMENEDNFLDPSTGAPYPFAFSILGGQAYMQMATISEKNVQAKLVGNYYKILEGDSPSLFTITGSTFDGSDLENDYITDNGGQLPYGPSPVPKLYCESGTIDGFEIKNKVEKGSSIIGSKYKDDIENGRIETIQVFLCNSSLELIKDGNDNERIICDSGYRLEGNKCVSINVCPTQEIDGYNIVGPAQVGDIVTGTKEIGGIENGTMVYEKDFRCDYSLVFIAVDDGEEGGGEGETEDEVSYKCDQGYYWNGESCSTGNREENCELLGVGQIRSDGTSGIKSITQTSDDFITWIPSSSNTFNKSTDQSNCYYKCDIGYEWDGDNCVEIITSTFTTALCSGKNWISLDEKNSWGPTTYLAKPTWNSVTKNYTFSSGTIETYPVFARCVGLGEGWRVPTIDELNTIYGAYCKTDLIFYSGRAWSASENAAASARYKNMATGTQYPANGNTKVGNFYTVCINDNARLTECEALGEGEKRTRTGLTGKETITQTTEDGNAWYPSAEKVYSTTHTFNTCDFQCNTDYTWDGEKCVTDVPTVSCVGKQWKSYSARNQWALASGLVNPTWNTTTKSYTFTSGSIDDFPLFKWCTLIGQGWRVPTLEEVNALYSDTTGCKSSMTLYSGNWTWTASETGANTARYKNMVSGVQYPSNGNTKQEQFYTLCVNDDARISECETLEEGEVRTRTGTYSIETVSQTPDGEGGWTPVTTKTYNTVTEINKCNFKCEPEYTWDGEKCVTDVPVVSCEGKDWMSFSHRVKWGNASGATNPTWNSVSKEYSFARSTIHEYPVFWKCTRLGEGWRVPTLAELGTLYKSECKSSITFYPYRAWTSNETGANTARYKNMVSGVQYPANGNIKQGQFYTICVRD